MPLRMSTNTTLLSDGISTTTVCERAEASALAAWGHIAQLLADLRNAQAHGLGHLSGVRSARDT